MTGHDRKAINIARWVEARNQQLTEGRARLDGLVDPVARVVLDLHAPAEDHFGLKCQGCPSDDVYGDADHLSWPCTTTRAVADVYSIDLPPDTGWADDPDFDPHAPIPGHPTTFKELH